MMIITIIIIFLWRRGCRMLELQKQEPAAAFAADEGKHSIACFYCLQCMQCLVCNAWFITLYYISMVVGVGKTLAIFLFWHWISLVLFASILLLAMFCYWLQCLRMQCIVLFVYIVDLLAAMEWSVPCYLHVMFILLFAMIALIALLCMLFNVLVFIVGMGETPAIFYVIDDIECFSS